MFQIQIERKIGNYKRGWAQRSDAVDWVAIRSTSDEKGRKMSKITAQKPATVGRNCIIGIK